MSLNDTAVTFLGERNLPADIASRYGLRSVNRPSGTALVFPYTENGILVNEKFRLLPKNGFWQHPNRRKILWNADALGDPSLRDGSKSLVITEGELDALAGIEAGHPFSVSVPDGAPPPAGEPSDEAPSDPRGRYEFIWNHRTKMRGIKNFVLATDDDPPGERLREELMRLLGAASCSFVDYPFPCKDLNEVLIRHGKQAVLDVIARAKPCPVRGIYPILNAVGPKPPTMSSGWEVLDNHLQLYFDEFIVITGIPQHGKSTFAMQMLYQLAVNQDIVSAIFTPEMPIWYVVEHLTALRTGKVDSKDEQALDWINNHFVVIGSDPTGDEDDDFTLDWIIEKATEAVLRYNIRVLLIDPWNEVEHARNRNESQTEYVARGIRMLKRFARERRVIVIVVAHPTKMETTAEGKLKMPSLYDISDSAAWFNKADHGIVIYRHYDHPRTDVNVAKVRLARVAGVPGRVSLKYDDILGKFTPLDMPNI